MRELTNVRRTAEKLERTRVELREAILAARSAGATLPEIAAAAGVTKQRVHQIVREDQR
jgi:predicted transcriptional regulator